MYHELQRRYVHVTRNTTEAIILNRNGGPPLYFIKTFTNLPCIFVKHIGSSIAVQSGRLRCILQVLTSVAVRRLTGLRCILLKRARTSLNFTKIYRFLHCSSTVCRYLRCSSK
jgi:hypothetical protein